MAEKKQLVIYGVPASATRDHGPESGDQKALIARPGCGIAWLYRPAHDARLDVWLSVLIIYYNADCNLQ